MAIRKHTMWFGLFFMCVGSVCATSATGAEQAEGANNTAPDAAPAAVSADSSAKPAPTSNAPQDKAGRPASNGVSAPTSAPGSVQPVDGPDRQPDAAANEGGAGEGQNMFADDTADAQSGAQNADDDVPAGQQVEVGSFGQIDLHVKDLPLTKVLQLLSIQSRRNIVASREVSGKISADLYGVGFYEALDAILATNGFGYEEKGNFIYVYTQEQMKARKEAQRELKTKVVRLNYIPAADASAFVQPMLSSAGSISVSGEVEDGMQPNLSDGGANSYAHAEMLVLHDYAENIERIMKVVEELDKRPKQVQIEATILQARLTENNAFGVDFALFADLEVDDFTQPLGSVDDLISGTGRGGTPVDSGGGIQSTAGQTGSGQSTIKLGFLGSDAAAFIKALDSVTDTTVLARPQMLVLNRQRAELLVGQRLGFLSTTETDVSSTQTVEFLDIGTQLTVRPFVSDDGFVRMELRPSVSDGETELVGGFVIPDQTTQELTTNVMVRSGQTVVLGGLFKEDTEIGRRQVPGVADVPIVGNAFKGQDDTVSRSEVIFMIKPTVRKDEKLYADAERAGQDIELTRVGARDGLLPWANDKLTSSHMKKAYQYLRDGNKKKALWHTNLALHINPTLVEALRLKERLSGEEMKVGDRSILHDAVNSMVDEQAPEPKHDDAGDQGMNDADDADAQAEADSVTDEMIDQMSEEAADESAEETAETPAENDAEGKAAEGDADADADGDVTAEAEADAKAEAVEADAQEDAPNEAQKAEAETSDAPQAPQAVEAEAEQDTAMPGVQTVSDERPVGDGDATDGPTTGEQTEDQATEATEDQGGETQLMEREATDGGATDPADPADAEQDDLSSEGAEAGAGKADADEADATEAQAAKAEAGDGDAAMEAAMQSAVNEWLRKREQQEKEAEEAEEAQADAERAVADDGEADTATVQPASDTSAQ